MPLGQCILICNDAEKFCSNLEVKKGGMHNERQQWRACLHAYLSVLALK